MTHAESKPDESHWYVHAQLLRIKNKIYCNANPDPEPVAVMIDTPATLSRIKSFFDALGCNSIDILDGLNLHLNPHLNNRHILTRTLTIAISSTFLNASLTPALT